MKSKVIYILKIVGISLLVLILAGYAVFAAVMAGKWRAERVCETVNINILDYDRYQFLCEDDVTHAIEKARLQPAGTVITSSYADKIEKCVERINVVKRAECYTSSEGDLIINVTQRDPVYKVITSTYSYYVDSDHLPMKAKGIAVELSPLVTGNVSEDVASGQMYDLVTYIQYSEFWNGLVRRINLTSDGNIELYTTRGADKLIIGSLDTFKEKLAIAELWYDQYENVAMSDRYTQVDLRYDNLIYCRKGGNNE